MKYDVLEKCDGCEIQKDTRKVKNLDPRHRKLQNFLCKKCDRSNATIKKIIHKNTKLHGFGDIFLLKEGVRTFIISE